MIYEHTHTIEVHAEPVPWARARRQGNRFFTDPKVAAAKSMIRFLAKEARVTCAPAGTSVALRCSFTFTKPPTSKNVAHVVKPDVDNLVKLVMDALNGIAWHDDVQVVSIEATKDYGEAGTKIGVWW